MTKREILALAPGDWVQIKVYDNAPKFRWRPGFVPPAPRAAEPYGRPRQIHSIEYLGTTKAGKVYVHFRANFLAGHLYHSCVEGDDRVIRCKAPSDEELESYAKAAEKSNELYGGGD